MTDSQFSWQFPPPAVHYSLHTLEKDPAEAEFRFPRHVNCVYLLGLMPHSLLQGVFLCGSNLRRQKVVSWEWWSSSLASLSQTDHLFPVATILVLGQHLKTSPSIIVFSKTIYSAHHVILEWFPWAFWKLKYSYKCIHLKASFLWTNWCIFLICKFLNGCERFLKCVQYVYCS